jgi:hypothetical protein
MHFSLIDHSNKSCQSTHKYMHIPNLTLMTKYAIASRQIRFFSTRKTYVIYGYPGTSIAKYKSMLAPVQSYSHMAKRNFFRLIKREDCSMAPLACARIGFFRDMIRPQELATLETW